MSVVVTKSFAALHLATAVQHCSQMRYASGPQGR